MKRQCLMLMTTLFNLLLCNFLFLSSYSANALELYKAAGTSEEASSEFQSELKEGNAFIQNIINQSFVSIMQNPEIEDCEDIIALFHALKRNGVVVERGSDALRLKFVNVQASIEQALSCTLTLGNIEKLIGVIHTPTPTTPLCTKVDNLDEQLLDHSIRDDKEKQLTIRSRAVILRDYLEKNNKLYIVYPQGGFEVRTPMQQAVYKAELSKYPDALVDVVFNNNYMDPEMIGATYFLKTIQNEIFAFCIKGRQAIDPQENVEWGIWLGKIDHPAIFQRVNAVLNYLDSKNVPQIRAELGRL